MSVSNSPTTFNHEWANTSPIQFNQSVQTLISASHEAYFLGTDLSRSQIGIATQRNLHRITGVIGHEGSSDLSSNYLNIAYCKQITKEITAGMGGIVGFSNYTSSNQIFGGYQIFASHKLNKNGMICLWHQKTMEKQIQSVAYNFHLNQTRFSAGMVIDQQTPIFEAGASFSLHPNFHLNTTVSNGPYLAGISVLGKFQNWIWCGKIAYHSNQLGFRPTMYINYVFQEQKSVADRGVLDVVRKPTSSE